MDARNQARIGIALSGGGSRAIAFHLGCLRALHDAGLLERARVMATVSGGSVIGGLYALHEGSFDAFEARVRGVLRKGLVGLALWTAVSSAEGARAMACVVWLRGAELVLWPLRRLLPRTARPPRLPRFASRTTILQLAMHRYLFAKAKLADTARPGRPKWIAVATELRTGSAFYFSAAAVGSWRFGRVRGQDITVAHAVSASAAFPLLLPALDETFDFTGKDGSLRRERVSLTDGGVYDNLGLAPLWPDRVADISLEVEDVDTIIACRAGDGLRMDDPNLFFVGRMKATVAAMHDRAQNATMKRLFDLKAGGRLERFVLPYLGQVDSRLAAAPADLIPREQVINYPTDFSPMSEDWIDRLSHRGEQLTLALLREHHPELLASEIEAHG